MIGFWKGWDGLLTEDGYVELYSRMIDENQGGTFLKSSRVNLKTIESGSEKALQTLNNLEIQALIVAGGEDTLSNALLLDEFPKILISKTIDNDVGRIEILENKSLKITNFFTLGYPTAVNKIISFVGYDKGLRTTAYSHERIIVVESMGMHAGWLALASSLGRPDFIIIPEFPLEYDRFISCVADLYRKQKHIIVIVAEGARWKDGSYISSDYDEMDDFGHPRFQGSAEKLCSRMKNDLSNFLDTRNVNFVNPSYLYRSGTPCDLDLKWGKELGKKAVELFLAGMNESMFLSIQRENAAFFIEPHIFRNVSNIEDFHRFVTESLYNTHSFSATEVASEYFELLI